MTAGRRPDDKDAARLRHTLDAARKVAELSAGRLREDLDRYEMYAPAVVRLLEIAGEAGSGGRAAPGTRASHPARTPPWPYRDPGLTWLPGVAP